ncbi:flagellar assembly protein FliW [Natranaerofaba carboxydovora]|uniref:flagellar assembly protein FliW n=1 Tax=Natranaerofaba carboxydovora TaxID=2742683 RepID=UPI001F14609A|nr:flagellar assembly protein FliW [Natranaerofaba carboxydovora]UMZ74993.1 Flagellar assembly factor FliW [Natranaerofaba carboxydovora]
MTKKINSPFLGEIKIDEDKIITFPSGLVGFSDYTRYLLLQGEKDTPFWYLQSIDDIELFFLLIDPSQFFTDYKVEIAEEEISITELDDPTKGVILAIVTVPEQDIKKATVNLQGPLIINPDKRLGKQVILHPSPYGTKHPLFNEDRAKGAV